MQFEHVATVALRDPTDRNNPDKMKTVPLFAETKTVEKLTPVERESLREIGSLFAGKMKKYIEGGGIVETARREVFINYE